MILHSTRIRAAIHGIYYELISEQLYMVFTLYSNPNNYTWCFIKL